MKKKLVLVILIYGLMIAGIIFGLKVLNLNSTAEIQQAVATTGIWGVLAFILLNWVFMFGQFLPTAVVNIAGVHIFGLVAGTVWNIVAVLSGAFLLFILGRKFGVKIAKWVVGQEDIDKWREKLTKGKYTLFILLLFPASPDSLLYVLAGMTKIKTSTYLLVLLLAKPLGVITTGLFGGGAIIPLTWAYAWLWGILGVIMAVIVWASLKHQYKIDMFINKITNK